MEWYLQVVKNKTCTTVINDRKQEIKDNSHKTPSMRSTAYALHLVQWIHLQMLLNQSFFSILSVTITTTLLLELPLRTLHTSNNTIKYKIIK